MTYLVRRKGWISDYEWVDAPFCYPGVSISIRRDRAYVFQSIEQARQERDRVNEWSDIKLEIIDEQENIVI